MNTGDRVRVVETCSLKRLRGKEYTVIGRYKDRIRIDYPGGGMTMFIEELEVVQ